MKKIKFFATVIVATVLVFVSCQNEDSLETEDTSSSLYPEISAKLQEMYFNTDNLELVDFLLPDGTTQEMFKVEGDILFTRKQIEEMQINDSNEEGPKQYSTSNLVSTSGGVRTLDIIGYNGNDNFGLTLRERTGLEWAVNNYNRQNLDIRFNLTFGTNYQPKDIVVYHNSNESGSGGSAGFPSGGNPNKFIQVYGLDNLSNNVAEHIIGHEIGHSIGLRHTDWFSRQSCGQNTNEGSAGVGAIHIPGTPTGYDPTSQMLACFSNSTDGEFNSNDIIALKYLY
ncbi:MAG: zinc-dependent metalloprotease [Flavobacteriaceae bacterium]|nr:zinc-dependent metalloprotease [Flavobacteriaceae bacterium]